MKEFIFTWWREISLCCAFLIHFIVTCICLFLKSKKQSPIVLDILELVPKYVSAAEKIFGAGKGDIKRNFVIDELSKVFYSYTGKTMDQATFKFVSKAIEEILATPQKKDIS